MTGTDTAIELYNDDFFGIQILSGRAWAEQVEKNQLVSAERDEAIRTKSQISTRAQAQAMNTASHLSKKVHKLEEQLAIGTNFRTVKAIDWLPRILRRVQKRLLLTGRQEANGILPRGRIWH